MKAAEEAKRKAEEEARAYDNNVKGVKQRLSDNYQRYLRYQSDTTLDSATRENYKQDYLKSYEEFKRVSENQKK